MLAKYFHMKNIKDKANKIDSIRKNIFKMLINLNKNFIYKNKINECKIKKQNYKKS